MAWAATAARSAAILPPIAALEAIDAGPFAHVVAVRRAAIEQILLQPRHNWTIGRILFSRLIRRGHLYVQAVFPEQAFLDADENGKVENRIVRSDTHQR